MANYAEREASSMCRETCPAVDGLFCDLASDLKDLVAPAMWDEAQRLLDACCQGVKDKGTLLLRAALVEACEAKIEAEGERQDAQRRADELERQVDSLKDEVCELSSALDEATA